MCSRGLKQGDSCSPVLFSLLTNELANEIVLEGKHGITLPPDILQILIMLFADDVVLLSNTIVGLQQQLNVLRDTAKRLHLVVNFEKSQVVIFRNGGYIAAREKWFYDGMKLKIVNHYKYLGITFSTGLTFSYALKDMSDRARKGVLGILRLLRRLGEQCPKLFFKLFDCQIQPMLTYGSGVWGIVYGESGRYPLYVHTYTRCIKYWLNLVRMPNSRLPCKSHRMLYDLHCKNKNNWVSYVCFTLYRYGCGFVWENQGVCNMNRFLCEFRQQLIDCCLQDWYSAMASKDRLAFYSSFKNLRKAILLQIMCLPLKKQF